ncbi:MULTISPECIES: glycosyltransferase family 2 protein [unclassified Paenibacillus]|uniref:glycosyltransferase family 2 protein n=1 Tax=unclassified Paenibacillus TaxID=185978 RepID=UPI001AE84090|nr:MULTISPECIES: glycosyltransferase family 2 protein [unclassified Paenibacillus]MBP1157364.1 cellulose synthase/poly-beta-1,6-N-acetylglucosamine synthase-like glycosyltransferase [Paenibacillus sp. PvP091]MBP1171898.1 cellulose synthase/poly-beta-1,6-N-acetylglucosamine synthase-like glycosyltransferase [Paenibacillus sp. PvR098]MBP2438279.1 cellulose synthase/poly-beta-1,6-N-acetylglucosamine synthase-like glycosyltransferase [Paenibacillus sp. PvP052]
MLDSILLGLQFTLIVVGAYQLGLTFFGWYRRKNKAQHAPQKTFAVLVAAHNEEQVVGALIENLKNLDYPKELYDIFVIADNCTDNTAQIARDMGVYACERHNPNLRGKGYAIEWMLKELWKMPREYDAVVMFDADNLSSSDYLRHMNNDLCEGAKVIQAYLDTKNPNDSWITASYAISYFFSNRFWQLPRTNLKLANFLGGTGMCFETGLLKQIGWGATSLVEDLEFSMRCVKLGVKPTFNQDAKVYDEKPLTFRASAKQRLRWMQGHFDVCRRYFFVLLWQGIKERSWTKIDAAIYSANVYNFFLGSIVTMAVWFDNVILGGAQLTKLYEMSPILFNVVTISIYVLLPISMIMDKASLKTYKYLILYPIFMFSWWPITIYAFFTQNNKQWSHTEHTRVIRLEDMHSKQAS